MEVLANSEMLLFNWQGFGIHLKEWIPLFQALVWPVFFGLFLLWRRLDIQRIFSSAASRIEQGDSFEAGASGVRIGPSQPKLPSPTPTQTPTPTPTPTPEEKTVPHSFYLVHRARRDRRLDKDGKDYFRLKIWLEAEDDEPLDEVASVTYHLHPTFKDPTRKMVDPVNNFELQTAAWGQFNLYAEVQFIGQRPAMRIERYINF